MPNKAVLLLVGDYVEDYEVMVPFQALQAFGVKVDAVCPGKKAGETIATAVHDFLGYKTYSESPGHNFVLNATFDSIDADRYDALVVPGGRAPEYLSLNEKVLKLVQKFASAHKPVASICHGPLILAAAADVLKGKQCTAYPTLKPTVIAAGGKWLDPEPISASFTDGNLITAAAWPGHPEFLKQILAALGAKIVGEDKKVLFICGDYMEDYEVMVPFQSLLALGYTVDAVSPGKVEGETCPTAIHDFEGAQTYSEKPGHNFVLTAAFDQIKVEEYDALVIPGGRAPEYLALEDSVLSLVHHFVDADKPIASICHGQQILAAAGVLKGKKCTAYPAVKPQVVLAGAQWLEPEPITKCFTDGNLVTGAAWPAHPEFVAQLIELLGTKVSF
ncbi:unnamed protein product [Calypogeia fissa]